MTGDQARHERWGRLVGEFSDALRLPGSAAEPVVEVVARAVPHADAVAICVLSPPRPPRTIAVSDPRAAKLDALQVTLKQGPLLMTEEVVSSGDLTADKRWPELAEATSVRSIVTAHVGDTDGGALALSFSSADPNAFDDDDLATVRMLATLVGAAIAAELQQNEIRRLELALQSSRQIGAAMGILMSRELLTENQAFGRLVETSQRLNRKVRDIADDVKRTGALPD